MFPRTLSLTASSPPCVPYLSLTCGIGVHELTHQITVPYSIRLRYVRSEVRRRVQFKPSCPTVYPETSQHESR
ncbi:hypothetical protein BDN72DRAFT_837256 [Pluteus cervinus]|uniref:Uncharacterized protein n=1 Tax=Pluteus cervinus TaxID=181527 RepID=A0ACD3B104_9AGAR|nr:hypothetical protein BDN72DRAFT_837256 [Pluteus cervinus]